MFLLSLHQSGGKFNSVLNLLAKLDLQKFSCTQGGRQPERTCNARRNAQDLGFMMNIQHLDQVTCLLRFANLLGPEMQTAKKLFLRMHLSLTVSPCTEVVDSIMVIKLTVDFKIIPTNAN